MLILILDNGQQLNYYKDYYSCLMADNLVYPYMTTATQSCSGSAHYHHQPPDPQHSAHDTTPSTQGMQSQW